jgi:hypothetical protein
MIPLKTKLVNPLDELFQTEQPVGDMVEYDQVTEGELAEMQVAADGAPPEKDEEDAEIDAKIDAVYDAALETFQNQTAMVEIMEPRYAARNAEVAANYLNIALNAASVRARVKGDRKKTQAFVPYAGKNANGAVVASREDILRMIAVDGETRELK